MDLEEFRKKSKMNGILAPPFKIEAAQDRKNESARSRFLVCFLGPRFSFAHFLFQFSETFSSFFGRNGGFDGFEHRVV